MHFSAYSNDQVTDEGSKIQGITIQKTFEKEDAGKNLAKNPKETCFSLCKVSRNLQIFESTNQPGTAQVRGARAERNVTGAPWSFEKITRTKQI